MSFIKNICHCLCIDEKIYIIMYVYVYVTHVIIVFLFFVVIVCFYCSCIMNFCIKGNYFKLREKWELGPRSCGRQRGHEPVTLTTYKH